VFRDTLREYVSRALEGSVIYYSIRNFSMSFFMTVQS
jgi:hypothetical protein